MDCPSKTVHAVIDRLPLPPPWRGAVGQFFDTIPSPADQAKIASGNAEALFHLT